MKTFGVIMAGGSGERFWPLSRRDTPKQLLNLTGRDLLVNEAAERLFGVCEREDLLIVTGKGQTEKMRAATAKYLKAEQILSEPAARNTAACIGYAAMKLQKRCGEAVMVVTPADAYIKDTESFRKTLETAVKAAEGGALVTVGIRPTFPATGYGYLRCEGGEKGDAARKVLQFVEKPSLERAQEYLSAGGYFWNSGMFVWKISAILQAFCRYLPEAYKILSEIAKADGTAEEREVTEKLYPLIPSVSVDYGIMEKAENILVVPGDFGWSDVGSFDMLSAVREADEKGNVVIGELLGADVENCVIYNRQKPVAAVGVKDLVIVETDDVLLVCAKDRAQDVKKIVEKLRSEGREELL